MYGTVIFENVGTTFCFWGENVVFRIVIWGGELKF